MITSNEWDLSNCESLAEESVYRESRMREICKSGLTRGRAAAFGRPLSTLL